MTQNANKFVVRLSNWSLLISFCGVLVTSTIDVIPSRIKIIEAYFYFFFSLFIISLAIRLIMFFCRSSKS